MYTRNYEINNYYFSESETTRVYMLKMFIFISLLAIAIDAWLMHNVYTIPLVGLESVSFVILLMVYLFFPSFLSLEKAIYLSIVTVTLLIILSLNMVGLNRDFVLFSLAIVPIYSFYFFGAYLGLMWSLSVILFLVLSLTIAMLGHSSFSFEIETIALLAIAYIGLTYLYYRMELRRSAHEQSLLDLLEKRTMLLKEVHHRSKNNLQTVMGLLDSQALRVDNEKCKKVLTSQRLRLKTMSMVHESLSGNSNYEKIEMSGYLDAIAKYIESVFGYEVIVDFDEIHLLMEDAMNIGLFVNEGLSNAAEHAYDQYEEGKIEVSMKGNEEVFEIIIRDYGKGIDLKAKRSSLGMILMEDICQFFRDSSLFIENDNGTNIVAKFSML